MRGPLYALAATVLMAAAPGWLKAGEQSVGTDYGYCTVCHGAGVTGNVAISAPALAGIEPWYLAEQLKAYREGRRGRDFAVDPAGTEMHTVARELTDDRIADVTRYLSQFRIEPKIPSVQGNAANGKHLYMAHCAACHGAQADGNAALHAPSLARLNDWYVIASYKKYRSGIRGASADNPWGNQMRLIAEALPDGFAIDDVSTYLTTIHTGKRQ